MDTAPTVTRTEVIDRVRAARIAEQRAAFEQLELALEWAHLHPCPSGSAPAQWDEADLHGEGLTPLAGVGAPWVAEFAPLDLAAVLDITLAAARQLIADALELAHRLPRLWDLARTSAIPVWRARQIAQLTGDLTLEAATFADRLISATPTRINQVQTERLVHEARLYFDPDRAHAEEEEALSRRGVWLRRQTGPATTEVSMTLDSSDAQLFDATLTRIAADLRALGDTEPLDVRRAKAVGIIADPQHALDLMSGREAAPTDDARRGSANLFVHLTPEDLAADLHRHTSGHTGAATVERLGALTTTLLADWLARYAQTGTTITLRPIIDLSDETSVGQHDPPEAMRELVIQRDATCVFPGCHRDSRICDLDHIIEYVPMEEGGPPGQTHPGNLAPLCRTTTAPRPTPPGTTSATTAAATPGPAPPATSTPSPHHPDDPADRSPPKAPAQRDCLTPCQPAPRGAAPPRPQGPAARC
jgi:hypothetical protein